MRAARSDADFLAAPAGAYLVARSFLYFWARPELCGFSVWGRPGAEDMARLERLLASELGPLGVPHASLVDARALEGVDAGAFDALSGYVARHFDALRARVTRLALVRPPGLAGAAVAGFFGVQAAPYPVEVFTELDAALDWVGAPDARAELEAALAGATGLAPVVIELRRLLEAGVPSLAEAARALGYSGRSLQRRLGEAGTSYKREAQRAQVRAAQRLLLDSDAPLTAIALEVGCATPQHFSALFRRMCGEAPSAWRRRHRRP